MKAEIYNYKNWITETKPTVLVELMEELLAEANYTVLNKMEHHFEPQGFTAVWMLAESHLAIHTFPEGGKTYVELSSCNEEKNLHFVDLLKQRSTNVPSSAGGEGLNAGERPNMPS